MPPGIRFLAGYMMPVVSSPFHCPEASGCSGTPHGRTRPANCLRALAVLVLVALVNHILIFHPFFSDKSLDDHGSPPMYDIGSSPELMDDGDTLFNHDRCGVPAPLSPFGVGAFSNPAVHLPQLNGAADHPPKA